MTVWPQCRRSLRQGHKDRRLPGREAHGIMTKPGERCGLDAFDIAAERRQGQVHGKDFVLIEARLQLQRARRVLKLPQKRPWVRLQQPGDLHGKG